MKLRCLFPVFLILAAGTLVQAQIFMGKTCEIKIFSDGPIEDIDAKNTTAKPILNTTTGDVAVKVTVKGFDFDKELMEEHFNEKYMESDKYPYATFAGKINEKTDYRKDGVYKISATGKLSIHGVEKERTIDAVMTIKGGEISVESKFNILLKDHNIEIPTLVSQNIAEVVEVTLKSTLTEFKK